MIETFDFLMRFWELRARFERLDEGMTQAERLELLSLLQLLTSASVARDTSEPCSAAERGLPVQLTAGSGFLAATVNEVGADGLIVTAAEPIRPSSRTVAYVADAINGVEYSLPCVVAWAREAEPWMMGLAIDGVPVRGQFLAPLTALLRSPLGCPSEQMQA